MFPPATTCLENTLVVPVPFKGEGSFFAELDFESSTVMPRSNDGGQRGIYEVL